MAKVTDERAVAFFKENVGKEVFVRFREPSLSTSLLNLIPGIDLLEPLKAIKGKLHYHYCCKYCFVETAPYSSKRVRVSKISYIKGLSSDLI